MEKIINLVAEKAGISNSQATTAVNTVMNFLKDKLPAGLNIESLLAGKGAGNIADNIGSIFGKK
jgi:nucleoid DNA-binding protein